MALACVAAWLVALPRYRDVVLDVHRCVGGIAACAAQHHAKLDIFRWRARSIPRINRGRALAVLSRAFLLTRICRLQSPQAPRETRTDSYGGTRPYYPVLYSQRAPPFLLLVVS